jgi:beta-mannosidase
MAMQRLSLNGKWTLHICGEIDIIPAIVPGSVYQDMLAAGKINDPFFRDNEDKALSLMENNFEYQRTFDIPDTLLQCERVMLRMDGLDTLSDVFFNGTKVLHTENMHRIWETDVKNLLKASENTITVIFYSPTQFIRKAFEESPDYTGSEDAMKGFVHLRKAHCMFGWDWGPRLPDCGIWRDISLLGISGGRIDNVHIRQEHTDGKVILNIKTFLDSAGCRTLNIVSEAVAPDGTVIQANAQGKIEIENPELWWPNGYGKQPLYAIRISLYGDNAIMDTWEKRIGLRTMTMRIENDKWGKSFCHEVNGVRIFAMGADYIPEDNLLGRVTPERTRRLLGDAKLANFNAIRVWGGGYYPSDIFYDICDELGLIVWQDFMFACGAYKLTDTFEKNIRAEFRDNIIRLRHHASLGLWCGNNEMELFAASNHWVSTPIQRYEYLRMYEYILPQILCELDPDTFYWPASPSSGGAFDAPNDENRGDVHYWDVWHGQKPFTAYRDFYFRYASEFGFQAYPHIRTLEAATLPQDRNAFSRVMEKHQRNGAANGKIMMSIAQMYLFPKDFESMIYASQLLQADAIRYGVEHWRRNRGRCMGAIYWQLNDCWPVISWSSIDYYFRWKALHYTAKRFYAPVMISCKEEGELTGMINVNMEPGIQVRNTVQLCIANETVSIRRCTVVWSRRDAQSNVLEKGEIEAEVEALSSLWLEKMEFPHMDRQNEYFSYGLVNDGEFVSRGSVLLTRPKHFNFINPELVLHVNNNEIIVTAKAYAKGIVIDSLEGDLKLSDNWFDMDAGDRKIRILEGNPCCLCARSVYDIAH